LNWDSKAIVEACVETKRFVIDSKGGIKLKDARIQNQWPLPESTSFVGTLYDLCKRIVYSSGFGGDSYMIHKKHPEEFPTKRSAEWLQEVFFLTLGRKLWDWQIDTIALAHKQLYLESPFGYRHYYWGAVKQYWISEEEILSWKINYNPEIRQLWGPQSKEILAFLPQNSALGYLKEQCFRIKEYWSDIWNLVHDEIDLEWIKDLWFDRKVEGLAERLSFECAELGGLKVGVEVKVGSNWGEMEVLR